MSECIDCLKSKSNIIAQQNENNVCEATVHETVCVQGTVTITPSLVSGTSQSFCVGAPVIGSCAGELADFCQFTVSQQICVQIPLTFSATATAAPNGLVCGTPATGECAEAAGCTFTIGFFRNHPAVTDQLITLAGGSILLGTGSGLSFTANISNAIDVLSLNTPTPPAPPNPPFAGQYQNLYAQLLAAKLNVLNLTEQGFPICPFVIEAITAADNFLGSSPAGGTAGAPGFSDPLELFNSGSAPGCPGHCA